MIEIFVCDDDCTITEYVKDYIEGSLGDEYKVVTMNQCKELLVMVDLYERIPDILIMDINLKDGNGIETVKLLQERYSKLKVIYLTGVVDYATAIFETNPSYFLLKPIEKEKLEVAIKKVTNELELDKSDSIVIRTNGSETVVYRKDIMYVESQGRKLELFLADGKVVEIYEKMDVFQEHLGSAFIRSHKSFLIHMKYIIERTNKEFFLSNGKALPISKSHLKDAKIKFISYLGEEL